MAEVGLLEILRCQICLEVVDDHVVTTCCGKMICKTHMITGKDVKCCLCHKVHDVESDGYPKDALVLKLLSRGGKQFNRGSYYNLAKGSFDNLKDEFEKLNVVSKKSQTDVLVLRQRVEQKKNELCKEIENKRKEIIEKLESYQKFYKHVYSIVEISLDKIIPRVALSLNEWREELSRVDLTNDRRREIVKETEEFLNHITIQMEKAQADLIDIHSKNPQEMSEKFLNCEIRTS
jgi:hypothetical protein